MPRLSIIIPFQGDLKRLEDTLVSVLENRPADCQILVMLSCDYGDQYGLADEVDFVQMQRGAGVVACINTGICASRAPIVHPLLCGVEVGANWADAALSCFDDPTVAAVAPIVLDKQSPQRVLAAGVTYHPAGLVRRVGRGLSPEAALRRGDTLGPDVAAAFYRKAALRAFGLFDDRVGDSLSTVDMALSMRQAGVHCVLQGECRTYGEPTPAGNENSLRYGWAAERLFWHWAPQHGWIRSLVCHGLLLSAECLRCIVRPSTAFRLAGRLFGMLSATMQWRAWRAAPTKVPSAAKRGKRFSEGRPQTVGSMLRVTGLGCTSIGACSNGPAAPRRQPG